jgi:hypothetical protein
LISFSCTSAERNRSISRSATDGGTSESASPWTSLD